MDDELQQLEAELKRLRPMPPAVGLVARVEHDLSLENGEGRPIRRGWIWFAGLPAAAAMAVLLSHLSHQTAATPGSSIVTNESSPAGQSPLKPVAAENLLVSSRDEGLVTLEDGTPARRERLQFVDTITWKNPRTNASLTWRMPREEVRVVPISFQ